MADDDQQSDDRNTGDMNPNHSGSDADGSRSFDLDACSAAVEEANHPTLLMVLHQLTGDERWLQPRYRPTRGRGMDDHDDGGLEPEVQREIRQAAVEAYAEWRRGKPVALAEPDETTVARMLSVATGEDVPSEYAPMISADLGAAVPMRAEVDPEHPSVLIIGAGMSGLCAAVRLRSQGAAVTIIDKNDDVGGTWFENRYPGCGVDTPSRFYSFSFFKRNWSSYFAKRDEVHQYLRDLVEQFELGPDIQLSTSATAAAWDETHRCWTVKTIGPNGREEVLTADVLVSGVGQLNRPVVPEIDGLDRFGGAAFHSARWPDGLDISGRRVAVVGSGASAMQIVPAIAGDAESVTIFQRSPQWIAPNDDYFRQVPDGVRWLMEHMPFYEAWYRARLIWTFSDKVHPSLQIDTDWPEQERSINATNDGHRRFFTRYLEDQLAGHPDLIEASLPRYPPFGKRMLLDNGWFAALKRPNVKLVTAGVTALGSDRVVAADGSEHPADVVVFATGFDALQMITPLEVRGRDGRTLNEVWGEHDATAHLGLTVPGFPNLFLMYGPNTNLGHGGSLMFIAECQTRYVADTCRLMRDEGLATVEIRTDRHDHYVREVDAAHRSMIWSHRGMSTWYRNPKGRVVTNSPWKVVDYWHRTRRSNADDLHLTARGDLDALLRRLDPDGPDIVEHAATGRRAALPALDAALITLAACLATTRLDRNGAADAIQRARSVGATDQQLSDTLAVSSVLGMHTLTVGIPLLEVSDVDADHPSDDRRELLERYVGTDRYWERFERQLPGVLDGLLASSPELFESFFEYSAIPWRRRHLKPALIELMYVAIDVAPSHRYVPGLRLHIRNALDCGATHGELIETFALAAGDRVRDTVLFGASELLAVVLDHT